MAGCQALNSRKWLYRRAKEFRRICRLCRRRNMNWKTGTQLSKKAAEASIDPTFSGVYEQKSTLPVRPVTRRSGRLFGGWLFEQVEPWMVSSWVRRGRLRLKRCKRQKAGPGAHISALLSLTSHTSQVQNEMSVSGQGRERGNTPGRKECSAYQFMLKTVTVETRRKTTAWLIRGGTRSSGKG